MTPGELMERVTCRLLGKAPEVVGPVGLEPTTHGLGVRRTPPTGGPDTSISRNPAEAKRTIVWIFCLFSVILGLCVGVNLQLAKSKYFSRHLVFLSL